MIRQDIITKQGLIFLDQLDNRKRLEIRSIFIFPQRVCQNTLQKFLACRGKDSTRQYDCYQFENCQFSFPFLLSNCELCAQFVRDMVIVYERLILPIEAQYRPILVY